VGGEEGRAEHGDADAGAEELGAQRLGQRDHRRFGRVVGRHGRRGEQARGGGDVEDVAAALLLEARREDVAAVDDAPQVDADDPAPVVDGDLADHAADGDAGVVDDHVDAAEIAIGAGGERLDVFEAGDIAAGGDG